MGLGKFSMRKPIPPVVNIPKVKQVYHQETNTFEEKPIVAREEKQLEILKAEPKKNDITFETLHADLLKIDKKLNEKQEEEIVSEDEHEFVESIESYPSGNGEEIEIIRFKHTDVIIAVSNNKIVIHNCEQDYIDGTDSDALAVIEIEESEKIPIGEEKKLDPFNDKDDNDSTAISEN